MTDLCDTIYAEESSTKSRTVHHLEVIALIYQLLPAVEYTDNEEQGPQFDAELQINEQEIAPDFALQDGDTPVDDFSGDVDRILNESLYVSSATSSCRERHC